MFPRFQEFSPLFRLLDDYDRATRTAFPGTVFPASVASSLRSFQPKFDVKELKDAYELHGELPGIDQKDISIEWTDGNTLTISGRTEHRSERGQPPAGFIEGEQSEQSDKYQKPSVEDEAGSSEDAKKDETAVTQTSQNKDVAKQSADTPKYWVTERSVGEFHRTFSFPTRVDQDNVKASLKDGILSITVPKAQAPKPRKINIE